MKKELFGSYEGRDVYRYTLDNGTIKLTLLSWGCVIQNLIFDGVDVETGFDTLDEYVACRDYYGACVGRYANRIANGRLVIDGKEYLLPINDLNTNCNHGGPEAFNRKVWEGREIVTEDGCEGVEFTRLSPDGENGFPGNLDVKITYILDGNKLVIRYEADTDALTAVNMTNHSYFNINGYDSGLILDHTLKVNADRITEFDALRRVTGIRYEILGSDFDLTDEPRIGLRIDSEHPNMRLTSGYGHNYILSDDAPICEYKGRELREHCVYSCDARSLTIYSDKPCLQVYTANLIDESDVFKNSTPVVRRTCVALEPQFEPDSANKGRHLLSPGEHYDYMSVYKFEKR
jgi:aldose 1-epimerase